MKGLTYGKQQPAPHSKEIAPVAQRVSDDVFPELSATSCHFLVVIRTVRMDLHGLGAGVVLL